MKVNITDKLDGAERALKDLHSILEWAKDHNVGLGEIVEFLSNYDTFVKAIDGAFDDSFGDFDQWVQDMIVKEIMEDK